MSRYFVSTAAFIAVLAATLHAQDAQPAPAMNQADTAWMLVVDRAGAPDDAGTGVLLRRARALQERAQHDDDELRRARRRRHRVGARRLLAGVCARQRRSWAACRAPSCATSASKPQGTIPHVLFMSYQGTFAIITAALISGAIVERMRFSAYMLFIALWSIVVYAPGRALGVGRRLAGDSSARSTSRAAPSST